MSGGVSEPLITRRGGAVGVLELARPQMLAGAGRFN